jgi:hypothetical protein
MYILNFFGTGIRYWVCKIPETTYAEMEMYKKKENCSWEEIFFDLDVLSKWGFDSWGNVHLIHKGKGWLIGGTNYFEVRTKGRRVRKLEAQELNDPYLLFDPYDKVRDETKMELEDGFNIVVLVQIETGLVFKYKIDQPKINLEKIKFHLNYNPMKENFEEDWITGITYDGNAVLSPDEDTLVRSSKVIMLNEKNNNDE